MVELLRRAPAHVEVDLAGRGRHAVHREGHEFGEVRLRLREAAHLKLGQLLVDEPEAGVDERSPAAQAEVTSIHAVTMGLQGDEGRWLKDSSSLVFEPRMEACIDVDAALGSRVEGDGVDVLVDGMRLECAEAERVARWREHAIEHAQE